MGLANAVDQLRCQAWLLARQTQRWGRALQRDAGKLAEDTATTIRRRSRATSRRLSRTIPIASTATGLEDLRERYGEKASHWLSQQGKALSRQTRSLAERWQEEDGAASLLGKAAKAAAETTGLTTLIERARPDRSAIGSAAETVAERLGLQRLTRHRGEKGSAIGKAAKATAGYLGFKTLFGRRDEEESHRLAWWVGFLLVGALTATYVATRRGQQRLRSLTPEPGSHRYPTAFGDMVYRVTGKGPPLVLIHGIAPGVSGHVWDANVANLAEHFRVYVIDQLGFGFSDKPDITYTGERFARILTDFLRDVVKEPAVLVAQGLSAGIAARTAAQNPNLAAGLVLENPTGGVTEGLGIRLQAAISSLPFLSSSTYLAMTRRSRIEDMLSDQVFADPARATTTIVDRYYDNAHQPGASHAVRDMMAGRTDLDLACELSCVQAPVVLAWGRHDDLVPLQDAQPLREAKPDATLIVFEQSAMLPNVEEPDRFNRLIIDHFSGVRQGG